MLNGMIRGGFVTTVNKMVLLVLISNYYETSDFSFTNKMNGAIVSYLLSES